MFFILLFCIVLVCSCSNTTNISNGEQVFIDKFDNTYYLKGEKLDYIQSIGFYGCEIHYPYLFLNLYNQDFHVAVYDIIKKKYYGDYFKKGPAPHEYIDFSFLNQANDSVVWINDAHRKKIKSYVLNQVNDSIHFTVNAELDYGNKKEDVFSLFVNQDFSIWEKRYDIEKMNLYFINSQRNNIVYPFHSNISRNDLNRIMTLSDGIKDDGTKIVSLTGIWDQIEIVDLINNKNNISVSTSQKRMSWENYQEKSNEELKEYYLSLPRCNDELILTLHNRDGEKEILLIDWNGNGIADFKIEEDLIDFTVDWKRQIIYGVTSDDNIYKYQFSEFMI